ncbi:MAG: C-terminal target protein, partial [Aeromicrobium sp.]|nr:C-terminal target protein [Aeromicrobium sp.]
MAMVRLSPASTAPHAQEVFMLSITTSAARSRGGRAARWGVAFALTAAGLAAIAGQPAGASTPAAATLVVSDSVASNGTNFSATSLISVNSDGTASTKLPVALPTAANGSNKAFALSGSQTANGALSLTSDGNYLTIAGYAAAPDLGSPATVPVPKDTTTVERDVARIDKNGTVDTSTGLGTKLNGSHPRSVVSPDGQTFYVTGASKDTPKAGVVKVGLGSTPAAAPIGAAKNTRVAALAGGTLYASQDDVSPSSVQSYGSSPDASTVSTQAFPVAADKSVTPTSMQFLDTDGSNGIDTAYVVIDTKSLNKYTFDGTSWTAAGSITGDYVAVTGEVDAGQVDLYAVLGSGAGNSLVALQDASPGGTMNTNTPTTISTAASGHLYHGVAFAPNGWILDKPTNVTASTEIEKTTVGWNAVTGADSYTVTLKDGSTDAPGSPKTVNSPDTSVVFDNLTAGTLYTATVVANNSSGSSPVSDSATATPDPRPVPETTTTLTVPPRTSLGEPVNLTIEVTSPDPDPNAIPDGQVSVKFGSHTYNATLLNDGTATVQIPGADNSAAGTFKLTGSYAGVDLFQKSSTTSTLNVARAGTTILPTSVVFNPTSLSAKKTSKVTITVSPTAGDIDSSIKPTGTVKFY